MKSKIFLKILSLKPFLQTARRGNWEKIVRERDKTPLY